jgi:metal-responsive CopG/Arc/MetJ family transcriptional regulator
MVLISIRIEEIQNEKLEEIIKRSGQSKSDLIRSILQNYLQAKNAVPMPLKGTYTIPVRPY